MKLSNPQIFFKIEVGDLPKYSECQKMKALAEKARLFAIKAHGDQKYDGYLPYEFHLRMAVKVAYDFSRLFTEMEFWTLICILWLHDTVEDTGITYADIEAAFNRNIAELVRALTNYNRGRNREERMPDWLYDEMAAMFLATAGKVCDRTGNVQYSKRTQSEMLHTYLKEDAHFTEKLLTVAFPENFRLKPIFDHMHKLLTDPHQF